MQNPNPFTEFPDLGNMTDRQFGTLCLFEIIELKAELRAVSSLLLQAHKTVWTSEQFDKIVNKAQDGAIAEMIEHAKQLMKPGQRPETN